MKIINTFVPGLYAFKYSDNEPDEFERVFDEWQDPLFLNDFFEENCHDLTISIEEAIEKVKNEAVFLRDKLLKLATYQPNKIKELFKNLDNTAEYYVLPRQKASNRWIRLYAIKIDENFFVVTGGAIKLDNQHLMQHRTHTKKELLKINQCRDYLNDQGVIDIDSFQEIFF